MPGMIARCFALLAAIQMITMTFGRSLVTKDELSDRQREAIIEGAIDLQLLILRAETTEQLLHTKGKNHQPILVPNQGTGIG
jgi:hypothetical protein